MRLTSPKREARYRQLLEAAVAVFARDGIDAASVADIAEAAGVAKGSVYLYFDSKEMITGDLVGHLFSFPDDGPRLSEDPEPLEHIVRYCVELEQRAVGLGPNAPVVLHMLGHIGKTEHDQLARGVRQLMAESRFLIELLLRGARERGQLGGADSSGRDAATLLALTLGVIHGRLAGGSRPGRESLSVEAAVRVYLRGIGAKGGEA